MKRIILYTASGAHNLGDECILKAEYDFLRSHYPNAIISVASYDSASHLLPITDKKLKFFSYFPHHFSRYPWKNIFYALKNFFLIAISDLVIIWWGGIFYDNEQFQSAKKQYWEWAIRIAATKFFRVPLIFWWIGIDIKKENIKKYAWFFCGKKTRLSVRDTHSKDLLRFVGIESILSVDSAFLLSPKARIHHKTRPKVWLALRSGYLDNETETVEKIIRFLQSNGFEPIFLSHSLHPNGSITNDYLSFQDLANRLSVHITCSIEETFTFYREIDYLVSMRLHATILAHVYTIPFLALSYAQKTRWFLEKTEHSFVLEAWNFNIEHFRKHFIQLVSLSKEQRFALTTKYDTIKDECFLHTKDLFYGL